MKKSIKKWPTSPRSHEVDNLAIKEFEYRCSSKWIPTPPKKDYGWDRMVTIKENDYIKGENFLVQIKGSDSPKYINTRECLSYQLKVSTINFLLSHYMPSMLCVCDTSISDKPIYWEWIQEAIIKVEEQNPKWKNQKTVSIQIPTSQILNEKSYSSIESYVKKFCENIYIQQEIGKVIATPYGVADQIYFPARNDLQRNLKQEVYPNLMELGVLDIISREDKAEISPLSLKEQKIHKKIKESSVFLKSFFDKKSEEILNQLSKEIEDCSDGVKAKYYNNCGVLALHNYDKQKAQKYFKRAFNLQPDSEKFSTNLLHVEYELALDKGGLEKNLPDDWIKRLESILKKKPDYSDATLLKAHWISKSKGTHEAEELLKQSSVWQKKIIESRIFLADIYMDNLQYDKALLLFEEIENTDLPKDEIFWSYYGHILFFKSIGEKGGRHEIFLKGPGPSALNRSYLLRAEKYYDKALDKFKEKGMPKIAEQTIANYTAVLSFLGKYRKSEHICELFLDYHPESISILENLVLSLSFQNRTETLDMAIHYAEIAYKLQPSSTKVFCNLILSLLLNEEYGEIIKLVSEREKQGFIDRNEEGLSKAINAISLNELGYSSESKQQIDLMKKDPLLVVDTALAEAEIEKRNGAEADKIIEILEKVLEMKPDNPDLYAKIAQYLTPVNKKNADRIINCLVIVSKKRQLTSGELSLLGKSFLELDNPEKAHEIFYEAINRYPEEIQFLYLTAISLYETGREEDAFTCLKEYMKKSERNYSLLKNLAILALNAGKLKESVELFEKTLGKTECVEEKAEIHCILYELKIKLKRPKKEILRHVVDYGKTIDENVDAEARYLIMFFLSPQFSKAEIDHEVDVWIKEFNERLERFSKEHPKYSALTTIKIPDNLPENEKAQYILSQLAYITLPQRLAVAPFELAIKSQPWPLAFRAQFLPEAHSIFEFWSKCIDSCNFSHTIHIWRPENNLLDEKQNVTKTDEICIDINALLTLAEFNMLYQLEKCFDKIIIARGTKIALDIELSSPFKAHPLAETIEKWRLNNLRKIRVRNFMSFESKKNSNEITIKKKLVIPKEPTVDELIGDGVGESILLARKIDCPLYSDDSLIRGWGTNIYNIKTFSTLSLLSRLMDEGDISLSQETQLYSEMIRKNFRLIPFRPEHLTNRLEEIVKERKKQTLPPPKSQDLKQDPILWVFLRQFGESSIIPSVRANIAINWWVSILKDDRVIRDLIEECMEYISFCLSQITISGVLKGIKRDENIHNAALLWALFWWRCNLSDPTLNCYAWQAIKENCKRLFSKYEKIQEKILYKLIPIYVIEAIKNSTDLKYDQKIQYLVKLTKCFESGEEDKTKLENALAKLTNRLN